MTTATITTTETKIAIALEVLRAEETGKTKKMIANEYGVSPRSISRYAESFEDEALDLLNTEPNEAAEKLEESFEEPTVTEEEPEEIVEEAVVEVAPPAETKPKVDITKKSRKEFSPVNPDDASDRRGRRGRPPEGVNSLKAIVLEILKKHADAETLTKDNRKAIIAEIMEESGHEYKIASKYFAGYKKSVGDYIDKS